MELKIGSFNVLNLNTEAKSTKQERQNFNEARLPQIAKLIKSSKFDIVALQELQQPETLNKIVKLLGPAYAGRHCLESYKKTGIVSSRSNENSAELAFIWNQNKISLCCDPELYMALDRRIQKCMDHMLNALVDAVMLLCNRASAKQERISDFVLIDQLKSQKDWNPSSIRKNKELIANTLRKTTRPPMIACFRPAGFWSNLFWEIRFINVHARFSSKNGISGKILRNEEMQFIQGEMHTAVNTYRAGDFRSVYTLIAGDYNIRLSPENEMDFVYNGANYLNGKENHRMITTQNEPTTVKIDENSTLQFINNYDHFSFDQNRVKLSSSQRLRQSEGEDFFVLDKQKKTISDHYPICGTFKI